jgi:hypothetical protein
MITGPLIITWIAGGAIGASAGFWANRMWKKVTHQQEQLNAQRATIQNLLDSSGQVPTDRNHPPTSM